MKRVRLLVLASVAALLVLLAQLDLPFVSAFATVVVALAAIALFLWLLWRVFRALLWSVGRRLAFSYFLLGVLPIPMLALLAAVATYLLAGFFLGHLYRDTARALEADLTVLARERLADFTGGATPAGSGQAAFAYYRDGRRIAGDARAPESWPAWVAARSAPGTAARAGAPPIYALPDGSPTLAAPAVRNGRGVLALPAGDLDKSLRRRGDFWIEVAVPEEGEPDLVSVEIGEKKIPLQWSAKGARSGEAQRFFGAPDGASWRDRPVLWWGEASGPLIDLATGKELPRYAAVTLNATPRMVQRHLLSSSAEVDAAAWALLLAVSALLLNLYAVAAIMAVVMIVGLSRAVNRLSRATAAVRRADFSVRIPVRRRDQVGDLQRSFNLMAENLESLVATSAQKEALEKELSIARELQQSLIPHDLPSREGVEFATLFEPSAAIGGDYFDILSLGERRLAVVVADVSGHGLSTGLRMAMLKAALLILVEEERDPEDILRRLDRLVRSDPEGRVFVTATYSRIDLSAGTLEIVNAGHPPTYVVRGGVVEEVLLPGSPLGGLGSTYGRRTLQLVPGDLVVWLSDGLIEAIGPDGTPFGYESVIAALTGATGSAEALRNRLLAAVEKHAAGQPVQDDRTLVVMRYGGEGGQAQAAPAGAEG